MISKVQTSGPMYAYEEPKYIQKQYVNGIARNIGFVWYNSSQLLFYRDSLYIYEDYNNVAKIYRTDPKSAMPGYYEVLKYSWDGTTTMTGNNGSIYLVENNYLSILNLGSGKHINLDASNWTGANGMAWIGSDLLILQNSVLNSANIETGKGTALYQFSGATPVMTSDQTYIYIIADNKLLKFDLSKVNQNPIIYLSGSALNLWRGTQTMTYLNGYLYIIKIINGQGYFYKHRIRTEWYKRVSGPVSRWTKTKVLTTIDLHDTF